MSRRKNRKKTARQAVTGGRPTVAQRLMEMKYCFDPIDSVMHTLKFGSWVRVDGVIHVCHDRISDKYYPILPAIDGWVEYWQTLLQKVGKSVYFSAFDALKDWLERDAENMPDVVINGAIAVVNKMRNFYLQIPRDVTKDHAQTTGIRFALEGL